MVKYLFPAKELTDKEGACPRCGASPLKVISKYSDLKYTNWKYQVYDRILFACKNCNSRISTH